MRQAGEIFLNGKAVGLSENGVTAYGVDLTDQIKLGGADNVLAVHVDNRGDYAERATGARFEWNVNDFNPNFGGINRHVRLHVTGPIYQTLPLYDGLKTTGVYVYPTNIAVAGRTVDVHVESQVQNASSEGADVALSAVVVDKGGLVRAKFQADAVDVAAGAKTVLKATGPLREARFWSVDDPYLYDVYTLLTVGGKVVDVNKVTTGFRKTEFKGGAGKGGVYLNDEFVYLKGFAQRASNEWAGLGQAYPDWMHDLTAEMIRADHGNYVRWMHVTPQKVDVESCDRFGIVEVAPAGDKERAAEGRQWEQRLEVMTASMVYLRNSPSILFWEAGNNGIPAAQLKQMVDLEKKWDPDGGRALGCRTLNDPAATPIAEYYGVMVGQDARTDALKTPTEMFRAYSAERRDRAPLIETEDFRDEGARRYLGRLFAALLRLQEGAERYLWLELGDVRPGGGRPLLRLLVQPDLESRPGPREVVGVCVDLLLGLGRGRPAAVQRGGAGERQGGRGSLAEADLFRPPSDAGPAAGHYHPRPLDLSGRDAQDGLRDRQHEGGRAALERPVAEYAHDCQGRLCFRLSRHQMGGRYAHGHRAERRQRGLPTRVDDRWAGPAHPAHPHRRAGGVPGGRRGRGAHRRGGRGRSRAPMPHGRRARRFHGYGSGGLARRL